MQIFVKTLTGKTPNPRPDGCISDQPRTTSLAPTSAWGPGAQLGHHHRHARRGESPYHAETTAVLGNSGKPVTFETSSLMKFFRYVFQGQGTYDFQESRTCEDSESRTCDFRESRTCEDSESRTCDFRESRTCEDSESRTGGFRESRTYKASGDADMQSSGISNR
jgi:hypothetical protein